MTLPSPRVLHAAQVSMQKMADRTTPFIRDEWYVVAFAKELGPSLLKRVCLDRRLVLYRTTTGKPVALDDRCAHRSYPLSAGRLDNDTIVCGYHGLRYNSDGDCIEIPSQTSCPPGIGVRKYPLAERGPLVWAWFGEPNEADESIIPPTPWLTDGKWASSEDYLYLPGNYVGLHENLLDLTHLSYVHASSFGTPDYARAPFEVDNSGNQFRITRSVVPTRLPPVWAVPTGITHDRAARIATSAFVAPGLHVVSVKFYDSSLPEEGRPLYEIRTAHIPTPETHGSTHYFIVHSRDFVIDDPGTTEFMRSQLMIAFREDVEALTRLEQVLERADDNYFEISISSDAPAVAMRKYLLTRSQAAPLAG